MTTAMLLLNYKKGGRGCRKRFQVVKEDEDGFKKI